MRAVAVPSISSTKAEISTVSPVRRAVPLRSVRVVPLISTPARSVPALLASARDAKPAASASALTFPKTFERARTASAPPASSVPSIVVVEL